MGGLSDRVERSDGSRAAVAAKAGARASLRGCWARHGSEERCGRSWAPPTITSAVGLWRAAGWLAGQISAEFLSEELHTISPLNPASQRSKALQYGRYRRRCVSVCRPSTCSF
jgi:hypothetical protein